MVLQISLVHLVCPISQTSMRTWWSLSGILPSEMVELQSLATLLKWSQRVDKLFLGKRFWVRSRIIYAPIHIFSKVLWWFLVYCFLKSLLRFFSFFICFSFSFEPSFDQSFWRTFHDCDSIWFVTLERTNARKHCSLCWRKVPSQGKCTFRLCHEWINYVVKFSMGISSLEERIAV